MFETCSEKHQRQILVELPQLKNGNFIRSNSINGNLIKRQDANALILYKLFLMMSKSNVCIVRFGITYGKIIPFDIS